MELPAPAKKTTDLERSLIKDGVRTALGDRQTPLSELVDAFRQYRKLADKRSLTLQGSIFEVDQWTSAAAILRHRAARREGC
jgi:hypothetical protein